MQDVVAEDLHRLHRRPTSTLREPAQLVEERHAPAHREVIQVGGVLLLAGGNAVLRQELEDARVAKARKVRLVHEGVADIEEDHHARNAFLSPGAPCATSRPIVGPGLIV